jgi:hypothetical protein
VDVERLARWYAFARRHVAMHARDQELREVGLVSNDALPSFRRDRSGELCAIPAVQLA